MRRQQLELGMGLRNAYANLKSSSFFKSSSNSFHQRHHSTLSRSQLWKIYGVSGPRTTPKGIFGNPLLAPTFYSNAFWKGRSNLPAAIRNARFYNSFNSLDSGRRSFFRRFTTEGVVIGLIVTNVAVYLLWRFADTDFMVKNFMISVDNFKSGRLHTLVTSAFSHRDSFHIISNMIGLYFFGISVGRTFGPEFLLKLYLTGAIAGSISYLVYHAFLAPSLKNDRGVALSRTPAMGASAAVNAIMLLDIFLFPTKTIYLDFIIPIPAILLGIFIIGKDVLRGMEGDPKVSGSAHLGGAVVAILAWLKYRKGRFGRF